MPENTTTVLQANSPGATIISRLLFVLRTIPYQQHIPELLYLTPNDYQQDREVLDLLAALKFSSSIILGKTQNSNESLNSMIWHHDSKAKRVGQKSLIASKAIGVLSFNDGSLAYAALLKELGMDVSCNTLKFFSQRDTVHLYKWSLYKSGTSISELIFAHIRSLQ